LSPKAAGGRIDISAVRSNGHLKLTVADDGIGVPFGDVSSVVEGVGLSNTRRRLRHLYGDSHRFALKPSSKQGVSIELDIPYKDFLGVIRAETDPE
jgi:signal transduction histidine kinase